MFEEIILLLFIALSKSKDYKCFAKMVPHLLKCFTTVTLNIVTLNKEESSTVIRCMINQNMKTGGVSFTQQSGGLHTWGDFICDFFFCFVQINCLQPQKAFYKIIKKKIDVHSVFKNGFIQRNSLFVVWVLQLVRVFLLWSAVLPAADVGPGHWQFQCGMGEVKVQLQNFPYFQVYCKFLCLREMLSNIRLMC